MPAKFAARPGFDAIPAVRDGFLREIKSPLILQPGPAALTDGLDALEGIVAEWAAPRARRGSPDTIAAGECDILALHNGTQDRRPMDSRAGIERRIATTHLLMICS